MAAGGKDKSGADWAGERSKRKGEALSRFPSYFAFVTLTAYFFFLLVFLAAFFVVFLAAFFVAIGSILPFDVTSNLRFAPQLHEGIVFGKINVKKKMIAVAYFFDLRFGVESTAAGSARVLRAKRRSSGRRNLPSGQTPKNRFRDRCSSRPRDKTAYSTDFTLEKRGL